MRGKYLVILFICAGNTSIEKVVYILPLKIENNKPRNFRGLFFTAVQFFDL